MKICANCERENPDDATSCQACSTITFISSLPEAVGGHIISPDEQRFWERMTFRQFAVLMVRLQALWFLFYAVYGVTYLPSYFNRLHDVFSSSPNYSELRLSVFLAVLRVIIHVAATIACIQYAERVVSWLIKDSIPKQPPL